MPTLSEKGLHHSCNSPPVEMNQPQNATLAALPPTRFLANEREILALLISCGIQNYFIFLPNWPKNNSNIYWRYFLSQTTTARPQTKLPNKCYWKAQQTNCTLYCTENHTLSLCMHTHVSVSVHVYGCGCLCVRRSVGVCQPTVCVYVKYTYWKNGKSTFFQPENNWSPEQLWVAHPCEVRVKTDQH